MEIITCPNCKPIGKNTVPSTDGEVKVCDSCRDKNLKAIIDSMKEEWGNDVK